MMKQIALIPCQMNSLTDKFQFIEQNKTTPTDFKIRRGYLFDFCDSIFVFSDSRGSKAATIEVITNAYRNGVKCLFCYVFALFQAFRWLFVGRTYIFRRRVVLLRSCISCASFRANKISLKPQGFNITLASSGDLCYNQDDTCRTVALPEAFVIQRRGLR